MIAGRSTYRATYGIARPDVGLALGMPTVTRVGFAAMLPEGFLTPGEHTLTVRLIGADGRAHVADDSPLRITAR